MQDLKKMSEWLEESIYDSIVAYGAWCGHAYAPEYCSEYMDVIVSFAKVFDKELEARLLSVIEECKTLFADPNGSGYQGSWDKANDLYMDALTDGFTFMTQIYFNLGGEETDFLQKADIIAA